MSPPQTEVLAKILLLQNMVGQLPDSRSIRDFLARGLSDLPGVRAARFVDDPVGVDARTSEEWPIQVNGVRECSLILDLADRATFAPYAPFVGNLCFMVTVMIERALQRTRMEHSQRALSDEVERRTRDLRQQVAERERAEREAVADRGRAEFLLEISELVIVELDAAGQVRSINEKGGALLGYPSTEILGRDWIDLAIPAEARAEIRTVFNQVMAGSGELPLAYQNEIVRRDGSRRSIAWTNRSKRAPDGRPCGTISAGVDISARVEVERAIVAEKERLATTLRSIGDGVITTDVQGAIVDLNEVAQSLTGFSNAQARGRLLDDVYRLVEERDQSPVPVAWRQALATGKVVESKAFVLLAARDGALRPVSDSLSPIRDTEGNTHGLVLVFRDVTERRRMFNNLIRADRLEALGVMAGGIAHDFNNLLGGVFGYMDLAEMESTQPEVKESLAMAKSVFSRARDLTQQLLTFAKGGTPIKKSLPIAPIVKDSIQFALSGRNVASQFHLPEDLWPCEVDKNQLGQVLDNLAINAIQAMPGGGLLVVNARNVTLGEGMHGGLSPGDYVTVGLTDSGIGIPSSILDRIFDPFFTTKQAGSGLGLATCHSIMQRHGGTIEVQSTPGKGSTFTLWLPAGKRVSETEPNAHVVRHQGRGIILVMDDEDYLLTVVSRSLQGMGYEVAPAAHGEAAVAVWESLRGQGSVVRAGILDLTVRGGMGGKETAQVLREQGFSAPLFATSGYSEDPVMSNPAEFGFAASLGKPFSLPELEQFLTLHLPARPLADAAK